MIDSRKYQQSSVRLDYTARAQAYALFAQALSSDKASFTRQLEQIADPFAVIGELVGILVGSTSPSDRLAVASDLYGFLGDIDQELQTVSV